MPRLLRGTLPANIIATSRAMRIPREAMDNPYKPSTAALKDTPPAPRSPILAVLVGLVVDVGGTTAAGVVLAVVYGVILAGRGANPDEIVEALQATATDPGSGYFLFGTIVGSAFSFLGGYICARMARRNERRVCAILALLSSGVGLSMAGDYSAVLSAGTVVLTFVIVMLGGELARRRNAANAREAGATTAV